MSSAWELELTSLAPSTLELAPRRAERAATWREVLAAWRDDAEFGTAFGETLAGAPFDGFFWEMPPLVAAGLDAPFRCVLVDAPFLAQVPAQPEVFAQQLRDVGADGVACFDNLGGDALMVVPAERAEPRHYSHLGAFLRGAPETQRRALWRAVADAVLERVGAQAGAVWLSTSGSGVSWLHVRLDARPKYTQHEPFKRAP